MDIDRGTCSAAVRVHRFRLGERPAKPLPARTGTRFRRGRTGRQVSASRDDRRMAFARVLNRAPCDVSTRCPRRGALDRESGPPTCSSCGNTRRIACAPRCPSGVAPCLREIPCSRRASNTFLTNARCAPATTWCCWVTRPIRNPLLRRRARAANPFAVKAPRRGSNLGPENVRPRRRPWRHV
jgi:hypothetical protein